MNIEKIDGTYLFNLIENINSLKKTLRWYFRKCKDEDYLLINISKLYKKDIKIK